MKTGRTARDTDTMRAFAALAIVLAKGAEAARSTEIGSAAKSLQHPGKPSSTHNRFA